VLSPGPFAASDGTVPGSTVAPHAGAGLAIGLDAIVRASFVRQLDGGGRAAIASLALLPRIRNVF